MNPTYSACGAGGDQFANSSAQFIHVKNADASSHTVTIVTQTTVDTLAVADRAVAIPAGEERLIGPFGASTYNDGSGNVQLTYDAVTNLTIAVFTHGNPR